MRLETDDDIHEVSNEFLGPAGYLFPWRARYSAYAIGLGLTLLFVALERRAGIPLGVWTVIYTLASVVLVTRAIGRLVSYEVPVRALASIVMHETQAPRPDTRAQSAVFIPGKVPVR